MVLLPGESRYATVDGISTHYVVAGEAPPVLLIHGLGASVVTWRDNIGPLSTAHRIYAVDLPGHGDSDKPDIDYAVDTMVRFVVRLLESLNLESTAIIGNSIGGALGLITALRHPELVTRLVLVDSAGLGREVSAYLRLVSIPGLGALLESSRVGGTRLMLKKVFTDETFVTQELLDELYRSRQMPGAKEAVVKVIRRTVNLRGVRSDFVYLDDLPGLDMPLMIVWGAQDLILPVSHAYRASEVSPNALLKVFDECGHWPHMERASEFNSLALDFLSE